jgi:hypothetical protein
MLDGERLYILFSTSKKYASWDPGLYQTWGIPPPTEHGIDTCESVIWITSKNAEETDASINVDWG